ncbi:MAG: hypothetical protein ACRD12_13490, partial [Acidimicrobiales bacterium]
ALAAPDGAILHVVTRTGSSRSESWQLQAPPYDQRVVTVGADGRPGRELGTKDGRPEVWNPLTNTVHVLATGAIAPPDRGEDVAGERLVEGMRDLLRSGQAHEDGRVTVDSREGIRIVSDVDSRVLVVDAGSYRPIEWTLTSDDGTVLTTRIEAYESLPATEANLGLLDVRAHHPDAAVVADGTVSNDGMPGKK